MISNISFVGKKQNTVWEELIFYMLWINRGISEYAVLWRTGVSPGMRHAKLGRLICLEPWGCQCSDTHHLIWTLPELQATLWEHNRAEQTSLYTMTMEDFQWGWSRILWFQKAQWQYSNGTIKQINHILAQQQPEFKQRRHSQCFKLNHIYLHIYQVTA